MRSFIAPQHIRQVRAEGHREKLLVARLIAKGADSGSVAVSREIFQSAAGPLNQNRGGAKDNTDRAGVIYVQHAEVMDVFGGAFAAAGVPGDAAGAFDDHRAI